MWARFSVSQVEVGGGDRRSASSAQVYILGMGTTWPQIEDMTELRNRIEEQIKDLALPAGVRLQKIEITDDTIGAPAVYIHYGLSKKLARTTEHKKIRELNVLAHAVMDRIFAMRTGRYPYVEFVDRR